MFGFCFLCVYRDCAINVANLQQWQNSSKSSLDFNQMSLSMKDKNVKSSSLL